MVKNECDYCYNILYNYVPLYLGDRMEEVYQIGPGRIRLMFTTERQQEVRQILSAYFEGKSFRRNVHQGTLEKRNKVRWNFDQYNCRAVKISDDSPDAGLYI